MKHYTLLFLILFLASCTCRNVYCIRTMNLILDFKNYTPSEIQQAKIYQYEKGSSFSKVADSLYIAEVLLNDSQAMLTSGAYDYRILINANTILISNLNFIDSYTRVCGWGKKIDMVNCQLNSDFTVNAPNYTRNGDTIRIIK